MPRSSISPSPASASHSPGLENSYLDTFETRPESEINADATVPLFTSAQAEIAHAGVNIGDWDDLLSAVKDRLRSIVPTQLATPSIQDIDQIRNAVLECVAALDQLQTSGSGALTRGERLKIEMFDAQSSLAQLRSALVGTQEAERKALHPGSA